jgi:hypothetical protein
MKSVVVDCPNLFASVFYKNCDRITFEGILNDTFSNVFKLGGIFDEAEASDETAFKHAVERVNGDHTILPRSRLSTQIERLSPGDSHHAANKGLSNWSCVCIFLD